LGTALILLNGIRFTGSDYLYIVVYLGIWLLAALVMFSAGTCIGAIRSKPVGGTVLVLTWIFLFYISPLIVSQVTDAISAKMKSIYQLEKEKWDAIMSFEERAIEKEGKFKSENAKTPAERELIESFMNREYKTMVELEKKLLAEMRDIIKVYGRLSLVSPCTFLSWAQGEMSSQGFASLVEFYEYAQDLKDKFCRFYKDKKFFSGKEENEVESFIKGEENVFYGSKRLPFNFLLGVIELLVLIFVLQAVSYFSHKKALARVYGEMAVKWDPGSFNPARSKYFVWQIEEEGFSQRMYNHLGRGIIFFTFATRGCCPGMFVWVIFWNWRRHYWVYPRPRTSRTGKNGSVN
nr:hypothetical protein [Candidatus Aminicenantes bacterium]NIM82884.1 hypothetical protein [Candidatus Aminicenantes bacterium]NIN21894.1 hypothetical protein [Candidatus Aminicenantes bacterium]NIN45672.1 hypothetical protein [Candidatus Aminicenantes bacterium]NIN88505.1 hypothetical protein [Candidatus Aminicenantes bacterium]